MTQNALQEQGFLFNNFSYSGECHHKLRGVGSKFSNGWPGHCSLLLEGYDFPEEQGLLYVHGRH